MEEEEEGEEGEEEEKEVEEGKERTRGMGRNIGLHTSRVGNL